MADTFEALVAKERERLTNQRKALLEKQREIQKQLADIDNQFLAVEAYEAAKKGRPVTIGGPSSTRAPRGARQKAVLEHIQKAPNGLTRGELIEAMGVKGDKSGEQSISNALNNMKKAGRISSKEGRYVTV